MILIQKRIMETSAAILVIVLIATTSCSAIPKPGEHKDRKYDPDLSNVKHEEGGEHNSEYDHEAFLGKDESKEYDKLDPEESTRRLGILVDKIDKDGDGFVTKDELTKWITDVQRRYTTQDSERVWNDHQKEGDKVTWESYKKHTFGFTDEDLKEGDENYTHKDMLVRDKRRWNYADQDKDTYLNKEEFTNFLHPEEVPHMKDVVVMETLDDIDKDKDGKVSMEEYIGDMWPDKDEGGDDQKEPDYIQSEREQFNTFRDVNKDGYLDKDEVKSWIMPPDYDHVDTEATHLISESDADKDGRLTKEEILEKHDLFAGSQATDFGEILNKHDEF